MVRSDHGIFRFGSVGIFIEMQRPGLFLADTTPHHTAKPVIDLAEERRIRCHLVRNGARLLTVITNDAWWGDTPGYKQHLSYSCLRAIETRRWIARSANTGISAIIDPSGKIVSQTSWWQPETLSGKVGLSDEKTFFVIHGDFIGRLSTLMAVLILLATLVRRFARQRI